MLLNVIADTASNASSGLNAAIVITLVVSVVGVIFASITAPLILAHRTERMHREDLREEYARQDRIAAEQAAAADRAQKSAKVLEKQGTSNADKLDDLAEQTKRIHILVNSEMTAVRQEELNQAESLIVVLTRVINLARIKGLLPDPTDIDMLERTKHRRDQLESILADREVQFRASEIAASSTEAGQRMLKEDEENRKSEEKSQGEGNVGESSTGEHDPGNPPA